MAATFENRTFPRPAIDASCAPRRGKQGFCPHALASLALSAVIALAVPSTQAVSHGIGTEFAANNAATASAANPLVAQAPERRPSAVAPRPMTSSDRRAIFMVLMLRDPSASSQILGLTH